MFARSSCHLLPKLRNVIRSKAAPVRQHNLLSNYGGGVQIVLLARPVNWRYLHQKRTELATDYNGLRTLWRNLFGKYLLATNIISSGLLMVVGDMAAQVIECHRCPEKLEHYDLHRLMRMFIVGALQGPLHHYVYGWMDRVMPVANLRNIAIKILIDQLVMSPACILIFFYSACYLEKKTFEETNQELIHKFPIIYLADWLLWPGAQYMNFRYLDAKYRVMFVNVCTALYNVFMSYMKHDFNFDI